MSHLSFEVEATIKNMMFKNDPVIFSERLFYSCFRSEMSLGFVVCLFHCYMTNSDGIEIEKPLVAGSYDEIYV